MVNYPSPLEAYIQTGEARNRNRQQFRQDIEQLGQGLGDIGNQIAQQMSKKKLMDYISQLTKQPTPATPPMQQVPGQQSMMQQPPTNQSVMPPQAPPPIPGRPGTTPPPPDAMKLMSLYGNAFPTQTNPFASTVTDQLDPLKQAEARKAQALAGYYERKLGAPQQPDLPERKFVEQKNQFQQKMKLQANIAQFRQSMDNAILSLRKVGLKTQADRLESQKQEWLAQHWLLGYAGLGPQEATPSPDTDMGAGGGGPMSNLSDEELQRIAAGGK